MYVTYDDLKTDEEGHIYFDTPRSSPGFVYDADGNRVSADRYYMTNDSYHYSYFAPTETAESKYLKATITRFNKSLNIQSDAVQGDSFTLDTVDATRKGLGIGSLNVMSHSAAGRTMATAQAAIDKISEYRGYFGAMQNRMEHAYNSVMNTAENTQGAESRIRDTDLSEEMVQYSKNKILAQAGQSLLSQANNKNQNVLSLLP